MPGEQVNVALGHPPLPAYPGQVIEACLNSDFVVAAQHKTIFLFPMRHLLPFRP